MEVEKYIELNLLEECKKGNREAQHNLYKMYQVRMLTICLRYFKNRQDAEDVFQESWIKVFKKMHQYDERKGPFFGWINRIFVNSCLEQLRKRKLQIVEISDTINLMLQNDNDAISDLSLKAMVEILQTLPTGYRTIFNLYVIEGFTHKEIAEMMSISISTSKTQLMKAKALLREKVSIAFAV